MKIVFLLQLKDCRTWRSLLACHAVITCCSVYSEEGEVHVFKSVFNYSDMPIFPFKTVLGLYSFDPYWSRKGSLSTGMCIKSLEKVIFLSKILSKV